MILQHRVVLRHEFLSADIDRHILESARCSLENTCSEENGYIIKIKRLVRIINNKNSNVNGDCIFIVDLEVDTFLPRVGLRCSGVIYLIVERGVVVEVNGCQKMLLMPTALNGYSIVRDQLLGFGKTLLKGDSIEVVIDGVKFNKNNFSVFGHIE